MHATPFRLTVIPNKGYIPPLYGYVIRTPWTLLNNDHANDPIQAQLYMWHGTVYRAKFLYGHRARR